MPNKNGRIYPRATMQRAIERWLEGEKPLLIQCKMAEDGTPTLTDSIGEAKEITIEGNAVMAECHGMALELEVALTAGTLALVPSGIGSTHKDGTVKDDYELSYLCLTNDPA